MISPLAYEVSEANLQQTICELAVRLGWKFNHNPDSRRSNPGLPDLVLIHPDHPERGPLFIECKTERGRVRKEQRVWIDTLKRAGVRAFVVRPSQMDFVEALLRGEQEEDAT